MFRTSRTVFAYAAIVAAVFAWPGARPALAQPVEVKSAREKVVESAQDVRALGAPAQEASEFEIKREALGRVLELSAAELESVRDRLTRSSRADSEFFFFAGALARSFAAFDAFLADARAELATARSGDELKALAAEVESWRTETYAPELRKGIELGLVFQQSRMIELAEARLAAFSLYLKRAKAVKLPTPWEPLFTRAGLEIVAAKELGEDMRESIRAYLPAKEKLEIGSKKLDLDIDEPAAGDTASISELATASFEHVKRAYAGFIRIAQEIQQKR